MTYCFTAGSGRMSRGRLVPRQPDPEKLHAFVFDRPPEFSSALRIDGCCAWQSAVRLMTVDDSHCFTTTAAGRRADATSHVDSNPKTYGSETPSAAGFLVLHWHVRREAK